MRVSFGWRQVKLPSGMLHENCPYDYAIYENKSIIDYVINNEKTVVINYVTNGASLSSSFSSSTSSCAEPAACGRLLLRFVRKPPPGTLWVR